MNNPNIIPVKPIDKFTAAWGKAVDRIKNLSSETIRIAIIGAGAGGVELAFAIDDYFKSVYQNNVTTVKVTIISKTSSLLPNHNK